MLSVISMKSNCIIPQDVMSETFCSYTLPFLSHSFLLL